MTNTYINLNDYGKEIDALKNLIQLLFKINENHKTRIKNLEITETLLLDSMSQAKGVNDFFVMLRKKRNDK